MFKPKARFCAANGVLLNWDRHHIIMESGLRHFDERYDPECWGCMGPRLMGILIPRYPTTLTLLAEKLFYPVHYREAKRYLCQSSEAGCAKIMRNAVGYHIYGNSVAHEGVSPGSLADCVMNNVRLERDGNSALIVRKQQRTAL
ncbi:hypothetical protein SARC_06679 [Sphaeroforma arctica JP610]|uniref:Alpha 1,4-glycosyltransferase domain-containing protein n=1 Tax=Sphaeroforma arctica JP610 TaxID=667725 RepID=A0A0L0FVW1_9EUKA|nr:hypothetical protein SARC_06679 [Sphaeroforma arctica JP610]KNC80977.1 hypothetical protein SARC_06679 [Sphaeroforma arctica JP610]|eukprot:XP_014154879.1 hypothetical protein SARC_06679 [Sphaeroforma arctica JP610]